MSSTAQIVTAAPDYLHNKGAVDVSRMDALRESMRKLNAFPMWKVENTYAKNRPYAFAVPKGWEYARVKNDLMEAASLVPAAESQRRVAMLVNPAFDPKEKAYTTDTIYAGYQIILPGETAGAHRHVAFAMRWGVEGDETYTSVAGQKMRLGAGDLIITPSWEWHYHGNDGKEPGVWIDSLDIPISQYAKVNFLDVYPTPKVPDTDVDVSEFKFPWAATQKLLDADDSPHSIHHFKYKDYSGVSRTLGAQAERIKAGTTTEAKCTTFSYVYSPKSGRGYSTIKPQREAGAETVVIKWGPKDVFAIPSWSEVTHTAEEGEDAYLFAFNDRPQIEHLGLNRTILKDGEIALEPLA